MGKCTEQGQEGLEEPLVTSSSRALRCEEPGPQGSPARRLCFPLTPKPSFFATKTPPQGLCPHLPHAQPGVSTAPSPPCSPVAPGSGTGTSASWIQEGGSRGRLRAPEQSILSALRAWDVALGTGLPSSTRQPGCHGGAGTGSCSPLLEEGLS